MLKRSVLPVLILLAAGLMTAHGMTGAGGTEPPTQTAVESLGSGRFVIGGAPAEETPAPETSPEVVSKTEPAASHAPQKRKIELIAATAGPEGETETEWLKLVMNGANVLSEGTLLVDLHPAATLGHAERLIERARQGEIDLVALPVETLEKTVPALSALKSPMLFNGAAGDTALSVLNAQNAATDALKAAFAEKGLTLLGILPGERAVTAVWGGVNGFTATAKGLRVAIGKNAPTRSYWLGLGAEPKRIDTKEITAALAKGSVDAIEGTPQTLLDAGVSGEGFTLIETDHAINLVVLFIGAQTYDMLPESFRNELETAVARSLRPMLEQTEERQKAALTALLDTGVARYAGKTPHADPDAFEGAAKTLRELLEQSMASAAGENPAAPSGGAQPSAGTIGP